MDQRIILMINCFFLLFLISCDNDGGPGPVIESRFPESYDLREQNILTSVKDQGAFGTCWSFASNAMFEALIKRDLGEDVDLSEQFLINSVPMGPFNAMEFAVGTGLITEDKLPYEGSRVEGFNYEGEVDYKFSSYTTLNLGQMDAQTRIDTVKSYLLNDTPVVSHMNTYNDFQGYRNGVYQYDGVSGSGYGHIILIVGWQDDNAYPFGGYWIVKNSWGDYWGENGYFKVAYEDEGFADQYGIVAEGPYKAPGV